MRILVLSDIHSNLAALEAVLADAEPFDALWHLGDVVGYGPQPNEVVARLRDLGALGVRGNHDSAAIGGREIEMFNVDAREAMEWTRDHIGRDTRAWLEALPERREDGDFTMVHGSPRDPTWEYVTSAPVARANLAIINTPYCLHGHTHLPIVFRNDDGRMETLAPANRSTLQLDQRRAMVNPGSVGQPRDGNPAASYLVLDFKPAHQSVQWGRVAYDIAAVQAAMTACDLPARLIARLAVGL
jgi:predicted phosphodiesterase